MKHDHDIATLHRLKDRVADPKLSARLLEAIARLRELQGAEARPYRVERPRPEGAA